jgi:type I restriction enzyme S subunit
MSEVKNIPRLRFPKFEEIWNSCKVEDLFEFKNGLNKEKEFFGRGIPIINFMDVYKNPHLTSKNLSGLVDLTESEISRFSVIEGDLFFTRTSETIHDIGMSSSLIEDIPNCVFSGFTLRARPKENVFDSKFTGYLFRTEKIRKEITTKSSMTTRALTSGSLLKKVVFNYPDSKEEQQKIADFLTAVDKRIDLLKKKKTLLETYKKGVMKKIFNQEIRFKDYNGNDFPNWEEKKLGEITNKKSSNISANSIEFNKGEYTIYGATGELKEVDFYEMDRPYISIVKDGSGVGRVKLCKPYSSVLGTLEILTNNKSSDLNFLFQFLSKTSFLKYVTGSSIPHIYYKDYSKLKLSVPSIKEQEKISKFASSIDSQIELLENQIDKSKTWKKGLLQKMFV